MALCDPSGTSIAAGSGIVISGSGTPGDPWLISATDPVDLVEIENDIANIQAVLATAGATYVNTTGDSMTGSLNIRATAHDQVKLYKNGAADWAYVAFHDYTGTRLGWVGISPSNYMNLGSDPSVPLVFTALGAERMRIDINGSLLIGKSAGAISVSGVELHPWGNLNTSTSINSWNATHNKTGGAVTTGHIFEQFQANGTSVGTIHLATTSTLGIAYSSDRCLKENVVPVDDELALEWLRTIEPVFFNYKADADDVRQVGYIAQDVAALWPNGVLSGLIREGHGDPDDRTWDDEGNETTRPDVWSPWGFDYGRTAPILHSGLQALDRIVQARTAVLDDHESRITVLEADSTSTLDPRVDALETTVAEQAATIASLEARLAAVEASSSSSDAIDDAVGKLRNEVYYTRQMTAAWQYSNTTTTPPAAGQLRSNVPLTNLYMNKVDTDGFNRSAALNYIVTSTLYKHDSARIRIRGANGSVFEVRSNAPAVDNGTWINIPVTIVAGNEGAKGTRMEMTMLSEIWAEDPPPMPTTLPSGPEPEITPK